MRMYKLHGILLFLALAIGSCHQEKYDNQFLHKQDVTFLLHDWNNLITTVMVGDGFSPLLASRTYVYPNVAAYEVLSLNYTDAPPIAAKLNGLGELPKPDSTLNYCFELAAMQAFATVAKKLVYRPFFCDTLFAKQLRYFQDSLHLDPLIAENSMAYGKQVGEAVLAWAANDLYNETKAKPQFLFSKEPGKWVPTPPEYKSALEPYWCTLRTYTGVNPQSVGVPFTIPYSMEEGSEFYELLMVVYNKAQTLTEEELTIAKYWDDNPDQMTFVGHIPTTRRQMSPTSHWISITKQACQVKSYNIMQTAQAYTGVSLAIGDAIICTWEEKYASNLIRPVTVIQNFIDEEWLPEIVTPNFPEHTSGHSAISAAAANVLTGLVGDNFIFVDTTVARYGHTPREFESFKAAALEASWSRVYGGIHYVTGIEGGQVQGEKVAGIVLEMFKEN